MVGRISLAELLKRGYSKDVAVGSLAGAGTLGSLIPPSNIMIIYGVWATSRCQAVHRGLHPGLPAGRLLHGLDHDPHRDQAVVPAAERKVRIATAAKYLESIQELGPAVFLILCVLGSMYGGLATPSEAAGVGVLGALIVARLQGELKWPALRAIGIGAVQPAR